MPYSYCIEPSLYRECTASSSILARNYSKEDKSKVKVKIRAKKEKEGGKNEKKTKDKITQEYISHTKGSGPIATVVRQTHLTDAGTHSREKEQSTTLDPAESSERAIHVTKLGALANVCLAVSKGTLGVMVNSTGLIADAANSAGDLLCDAVVYYTVTEARKDATPDRPWGRGKVESLGALAVGGMLVVTGGGIGYAALSSALDMASLTGLSGSSEVIIDGYRALAETGEELSMYAKVGALSVSGVSVVVKELLFRYTLKAGQLANSSTVMANAWQHRADAGVSSAVFAGLAGSMCGYPLLDPLAALMVAGVIMQQGCVTAMGAMKDLSDVPATAEETAELKHTCLGVNGIISVDRILARISGPYLFVEVQVGVLGTISASAAHMIGEMTRQALLHKHSGRVANAVVDVNPLGSTGLGEQSPSWVRDHDVIVTEVTKLLLMDPDIQSVSEVQVYYRDSGRIGVKVDIVLPSTFTIAEAHKIAAKSHKVLETTLGLQDIDIDLELDEM